MSVVSLAEAKEFQDLGTVATDSELQAMLNRAEAILTKRVGPLAPVTVTDEVHTGPGPIVLRKYPVVSVTSATSSGAAVADLDADLDAGLLYGRFGGLHRAVKVTYVAGRSVLPEDLVAAVLELVRHLWESQRVPGAGRPGFQGYGGGTGDTEPPPGSGYLLPYRVQSLIEPYVLSKVAVA